MTVPRKIKNKSKPFARTEIECKTLMRDADEKLLKSLRNREDSGYETLVRTYGPQVMAIANRYLRSEAEPLIVFRIPSSLFFRA